MKVAVVGATGLVGSTMLKVLEERGFPIDVLVPVASSRAVGKIVTYKGKDYKVVGMEEGISAKADPSPLQLLLLPCFLH